MVVFYFIFYLVGLAATDNLAKFENWQIQGDHETTDQSA
jgi:hypothetical protein